MIKLSEYKKLLCRIGGILSKQGDTMTLFKESLDIFPGEVPTYLECINAFYPGIEARELLRRLFPNNKPKPRPPLTLEELQSLVNVAMNKRKKESQLAISAVRLTPDNRLQATLRAPGYKSDFNFVKGSPLEKQDALIGCLKKKWQIPYVISPESPLSNFCKMPLILEYPTDVGGFLSISINLRAGKDKLRGAFNEILDKHDKHLITEGARDRKGLSKHSLEPWEMYDEVKKNGNNKTVVSRRLSGIDGDVNNNPELNKVYQAVGHAVKQAEKMIERVEAEAGPPWSGFSIVP
jgi:hypothetical protein